MAEPGGVVGSLRVLQAHGVEPELSLRSNRCLEPGKRANEPGCSVEMPRVGMCSYGGDWLVVEFCAAFKQGAGGVLHLCNGV